MFKHNSGPKYVFVLGAADEEMTRIGKLIRQLPASMTLVRYATVNGTGVTSSNAYQADYTTDIALAVEFGQLRENIKGTLVLVECGFDPEQVKLSGRGLKVLDHHREGDAGFDRPAKDAIQASSLGQFMQFLAKENLLRFLKDATLIPATELASVQRNPVGEVSVVDGQLKVTGYQGTFMLPVELAYVAALDHNPGAVYQGKVPGLIPAKAVAFRNELRAKFKGITIAELDKLMRRARAMMRKAPVLDIAGKPVLDLRGMKVPDSHEVSAQDGIAVMYSLMDKSGRKKEGIIGASEDVIDIWMSAAEQSGLGDIYGAPTRGYAGGYRSFDVAHANNRLAGKFNAARH